MSKPIIAVTRRLPAVTEASMKEQFDARLNPNDLAFSAEHIIAACDGAQILVPTVTDKIDADLINALPVTIKMIANFGAGVDHIDLEAAVAKNVVVTNTPGVLTDDTADLTIALLLAAPRRLDEGARLVRTGGWDGWTPTFMVGHRVTGKRLGIIGMGRIGQAVAKRARGFDMQIHYHNRHPIDEKIESALEATYWESLDEMLVQMDFVSVNCPKTPETYHLLNADRIDLLQSHAVVINTARGGIIDEAALAERLASGAIAGAGLDVYENEPEIHPKLIALENVVLAPHLGSGTHEGREAMGDKVLTNIGAFLSGDTPPDRVRS
ncbi:MAG: D-glycerate dehydrogenase [Alphaproteobacteria bacterium]|nr:D-glycerate dehydrogenase [Alphaproteobacteria bacterium]